MFKGKIGIIWTLDRICKWNCDYCCVDAYCVKREGNFISIDSNNFKYKELLRSKNIYSQGQDILIKHGLSLSLEDKLTVLNNLKGVNLEIGFSGGDFLLNKENLKVVQVASKIFGKENIGISATGVGMTIGHLKNYLDYIGQLDFTFDNIESNDVNHKQSGYNNSNLQAFKKNVNLCHSKKVVTQALIPISNTNKNDDIITILYSTLKKVGVDKIYLMRTFPVGRGMKRLIDPLSREDYISAIEKYYELEEKTSGPEVNIMCALKCLFPEKWDDPCTFLRSTIDITSSGNLIADAFAYGLKGDPLTQEIIFGDLKKNRLVDLINQPKIQKLQKRIHENKGHCKVIAYINNQSAGINGFFSNTDPLGKK